MSNDPGKPEEPEQAHRPRGEEATVTASAFSWSCFCAASDPGEYESRPKIFQDVQDGQALTFGPGKDSFLFGVVFSKFF